MTEPVNEERLQDAFGVVQGPVVQSIRLDRVNNAFSFVTEEFVDREVVEDWIEYQRPQVFKEEECTIRNLWTQVLEHDS